MTSLHAKITKNQDAAARLMFDKSEYVIAAMALSIIALVVIAWKANFLSMYVGFAALMAPFMIVLALINHAAASNKKAFQRNAAALTQIVAAAMFSTAYLIGALIA